MPKGSVIASLIGIVILLLVYFAVAIRYERFAPLNARARTFVMKRRSPILDPIMRATHVLNGAISMSTLTAVLALILGLYWDAWRHAFLMTAAMLFETAFSHATKAIHKSERPPQLIASFLMKTHSYPSGHTAASMTFALVVPYFLRLHMSPAFVVPMAVILLFNAFLTAYGRLYLDMHWLADLIGGWCMAGITALGTHLLMQLL